MKKSESRTTTSMSSGVMIRSTTLFQTESSGSSLLEKGPILYQSNPPLLPKINPLYQESLKTHLLKILNLRMFKSFPNLPQKSV